MDTGLVFGMEPPPPGQVANFVNPDSDGYKIIVLNVVMLVVTAIVTALRLYTRIYIVKKNLALDDYFLLAGWVQVFFGPVP
ncbi:uncharacterized protein BP5553_08707 [Venustampulla echinocandica]|uniref:Integral membrane protein n=1 Tax=Venustampulla echinocandica TaxID=2656787 RepID=A0A370TF02_9HELO|nr:uncharacterized protein BP5553_08707 [Venustampulla echinocandica]RDL33268.1 hypothetical protein BP5553_08707 [Venustampulla echinocandica]